MRIAVNASIVHPVLSGLGVYTVNLLRELARLHDDLVVYTSWPEVLGLNSTRVKRIRWRKRSCRGLATYLRQAVWMHTSLPFQLQADKASVLLSPSPEGTLLPLVPQVVVVHDLIPLRFPEVLPRHFLYFRYFVPSLLRRSRAIVAVSASTKKDLTAFYGVEPARISVVPNGLDASRYRVGIDATEVKCKYRLKAYLLYVGNLLPHKNLKNLLKAFALIAHKFPHTLVIAGRKDPRYHPSLAAEAAMLGLQERVAFLDYVPLEDLPALYAGADLFVLPSLYEGFGLPILEAMACGIAVISSHASSLPEVGGDAALLVDPYDVLGMAATMEAVLGDAGVRATLRRKGLEQAQRFSWRRTAMRMLEVLRGVEDR
jgi:glycosyltransferase involved in cell wall biosynthesis